MSGIALYNALRKIPEISDAEAKEAVADVASSKEVATKSDIVELKAEIYRINNRTIMWMVGIGLAIVGLIKYL